MKRQPIGKFYDKLNITFSLGKVHCHALKLSFEQYQRSFPSHSHSSNSWEIHYIAYGKGHITLDKKPYEIASNSFFITGPHVEHSQFSDSSDPIAEYCIYLKFDTKAAELKHNKNPGFLERFLNTPSFFGQDTQNIHGLMQNIFHELDGRNTGYLPQVNTLLTQLLVLSVRNYERAKESYSFFEPASLTDRNYLIIEECFLYEYHDLTLEILSTRLGLSQRQTERILREHYGMTFLQKKTEAKMSAASILLHEEENTITDVALSLGYSSVEHFSTAFRRYYGMSPRAYKRQTLLP